MIDRRKFLYTSLVAVTGSYLPFPGRADRAYASVFQEQSQDTPFITDTNINLFEWPFRNLKYSRTESLLTKLREHRINRACAGSYEALFHKDLDGVNRRLFDECRNRGEGVLIPFGTINIGWPGWEEHLGRCHEQYNMTGIRIYPGYQAFDLSHPDFRLFLQMIAKRGMVLQIACDMEDSRVHHPVIEVRDIRMDLLPGLAKDVPEAKIQLLYWNHRVSRNLLDRLITETNVVLDTSRIENTGGVGRLIEGNPWSGDSAPVPASRILFGSHMPYFPVEANVLKLFESPLPLEQMNAIMYENANHLLDNRL